MIGATPGTAAAWRSAAWSCGLPRRLAEIPSSRQPTTAEERRSLYLRDGDVIPSVITKIDAEGVWFKTSLSKSTFVPHAKVKAVELACRIVPNSSDDVVLSKSKKERLLTLPQDAEGRPAHAPDPLQKRRLPPRAGHAVWTPRTLEVEVRLENKDVPRDRISRIIWLHRRRAR